MSIAGANAQTQESSIPVYRELQTLRSLEQQKQLSKKQKKRLRAIEDSIAYAETVNALASHDFVVEADQLQFKRGRTAFVSSITNFIRLDGDKAVVQVAPFNSIPGINGVGGITVEGRASDIKIKTDKKGNTFFTMNVNGTAISAIVSINVYKGSDRATVTITPNLNSQRITLFGTIKPTSESSVFKGSSI